MASNNIFNSDTFSGQLIYIKSGIAPDGEGITFLNSNNEITMQLTDGGEVSFGDPSDPAPSPSTFKGEVVLQSGIVISGNSVSEGNFTTQGDSITVGNTSITNSIGVGSNLSVTGNSTTVGNSTTQGDSITQGNTSISNSMGVGSNLVVTGDTTTEGNISVTNSMGVGGSLIVTGDLTINGTTTTINSTTLQVDDKNIEMGVADSPTDSTADGGGITLKGDTDKTIAWSNSTDNWESSEHFSVADGKYFKSDKLRARDGDGLYLVDDADNGIFVKDGGFVGIGTVNPSAPLEISTTSDQAVRINQAGGAFWNYLSFYHDDQFKGYVGTVGSTDLDLDGGLTLTALAGENLYFRTAVGSGGESGSLTDNRITIKNSNGYVGIGTEHPTSCLEVKNTHPSMLGLWRAMDIRNSAIGTAARIEGGALNNTTKETGAAIALGLFDTSSNGGATRGYISFETKGAGGLEERVRIDENGRMGINHNNPVHALDVSGFICANSPNPGIRFMENDTTDENWDIQNSAGNLLFGTISDAFGSAAEKMRLTQDGKLGIGNTTPGGNLTVAGPAQTGANDTSRLFEVGADGTTDVRLIRTHHDGYATMKIWNQHTHSKGARLQLIGNDTVGGPTMTGQQLTLQVQPQGGPRGALSYLNYNASVMAGMGTQPQSSLYINGGHVYGSSSFDLPSHVDSSARMELGRAALQWKEIFCVNATINTSDERDKQDILDIEDAEKAVAVKAKALLKKYRWKDAVEQKGDDARIHFGLVAQDLKSAFESEGLDPYKYSMFCWDEWWRNPEDITDVRDEETEGFTKEDKFGIRYEELFAFILAAL